MAGLAVSGIILSLLDWRSLFYVNVPIGIFGTAWAHFRLREIGKLERGAAIDWGVSLPLRALLDFTAP